MNALRELRPAEIASRELTHLLRLAVEGDEASLAALLCEELPRLSVHGVVDDGRVLGFVAFDAGTDPVTIEYIAVDESARERRLGAALVGAAARFGRAVYAQTDDDAVGFYRRLGFAIVPCDPDPRWPERQRYDFLLDAGDRAGT
ncbi:MAG: GNAT family N-acetyltransferase [Nocardioidaceae bacterium]|nr:GNAT family N-acetyltransferase [Nocardioidaceae bacterium]MCL2613808.1 GNAT family N-acetyltransferase [Nocardioidaceae bacterium]